MCPQVEQRFRLFISQTDPIVESEDCLYLNVFVPVDVSIVELVMANCCNHRNHSLTVPFVVPSNFSISEQRPL